MHAFPLTALITLLVLAVFFGTAINVGRARGRYQIKPPAVSGHEMFDRAFRIQMNTLEGMALMLPALWLAAVFKSDGLAAICGAIWVAGRIWYALGYMRDPAKREGGFVTALLAFVALWGIALWGVMGALG